MLTDLCFCWAGPAGSDLRFQTWSYCEQAPPWNDCNYMIRRTRMWCLLTASRVKVQVFGWASMTWTQPVGPLALFLRPMIPVWLLWVLLRVISPASAVKRTFGGRPVQKGWVSRQTREARPPLDQRVSVWRVGLRMLSFVTSNLPGSPLGPGNFDWTFAPLDIMWTTGSETHFICFWKCHFDWWGQHLNLF